MKDCHPLKSIDNDRAYEVGCRKGVIEKARPKFSRFRIFFPAKLFTFSPSHSIPFLPFYLFSFFLSLFSFPFPLSLSSFFSFFPSFHFLHYFPFLLSIFSSRSFSRCISLNFPVNPLRGYWATLAWLDDTPLDLRLQYNKVAINDALRKKLTWTNTWKHKTQKDVYSNY